MPTPAVTALADRVRAHLKAGAFREPEPADLPPDLRVLGAETAARVVLADVEHRDWEERAGFAPAPRVWEGLAAQLRLLEDVARRRPA